MAPVYISAFIQTVYAQLCHNCAHDHFKAERGIIEFIEMLENVSQCQ